MYADYIAARAASAKIDGTPALRIAFTAFLEAQTVASASYMRGLGPSGGLLGVGNPSITLPQDRKETRHKDACGTTGPATKKPKVV